MRVFACGCAWPGTAAGAAAGAAGFGVKTGAATGAAIGVGAGPGVTGYGPAAEACGSAALEDFCAMWLSTSCFVIRPPAPVPFTFARSILFSRAILRTSGESGPAASCDASSVAGGAAAAAGAGSGSTTGPGAEVGGAGAGAGAGAASAALGNSAGAAAGAATGAPPASPMRATTVLIPTVSPSCTSTSVKVPADGEGISVSTLSVEISNSGSSRSTVSPGFFNHLVSVPSTILSPICGITTSIRHSLPIENLFKIPAKPV